MSPRVAAALIGVVLLAAALRIRYFTGLTVGDDMVYSIIAVDRLSGKTDFDNVHQTRVAFLLPIMASYATLGPGEVPLVLYNLLCSIATVVVAFYLARMFFGDTAALLAAIVVATHPLLIYFASECHTDTPQALWMALLMLLFFKAEKAENPRGLLVLAGLVMGWGYLHKEVGVALVPFFAAHWWITKRRWAWYLPMAIAAFSIFALECAFYAGVTGNPLHRFALVRSAHTEAFMDEFYTTPKSVIYRITVELAVRLFSPWYGHHTHGIVNLLGLGAGLALLAARIREARPFLGWFLALYLFYALWPSRFYPYSPGFFLFEWTLPVFMVPLACLLGAALARLPRTLAIAAVVAIATMNVYAAHKTCPEGRKFAAGAKEAAKWVKDANPPRVVADAKTLEVLDFMDGHRPRRKYEEYKDARDYRGSVVIVERFWTEPRKWWSQPKPDDVPNPAWKKDFESPRVVIYRP